MPRSGTRKGEIAPGSIAFSKLAAKRRVYKYVKDVKGPAPKGPRKARAACKSTRATFSAYPKRHSLLSRKQPKQTVLRENITPGTVLILLSGRYRGRRVVFLKQLDSGLLLVTGPYKLNGVPLRRVNQAYVISTSVKLDVSGVTVPETITDASFKKPPTPKVKKTEANFFGKRVKSSKSGITKARKAEQKAVDEALLPLIKAEADLVDYLRSRFSLQSKQYPHTLKF